MQKPFREKFRTGNRAIYALLVACLASTSFGCKPTISESNPSNKTPENRRHREPPVVLPFGVKSVSLEIENSNGLAATLYRIDGNESIAVQELEQPVGESRAIHAFTVPSGVYMVQLASGSSVKKIKCAYPAPALANVLDGQPVQLEVREFPKPDPGWCWIPAGPSIVGDTLGIGAEDERPAKIINIDGFWLAESEVTNAQYAEFLSGSSKIEARWIDLESKKCRIQQSTNGFKTDAADLPVVMVSYYGAQAYCDWLSKKTRSRCRLPIESEWEKAARGPESFIFSYGNVYKQSLANQESGKLKPVKSYAQNGFGLYDMTGNVFEWMSNLNDPTKPDRIMNQSLRGGSFVLDGMYLRNSFRMRQSKSVMTDDIGFRVARDFEPIK